MVEDEELKRFHDWLHEKGDDPKIVLALRWIAEFELYAEQDEEELREFKVWLMGRNDPQAASALRFVALFEETVEPDPMLKRLDRWLQTKGNDPIAVLVVGWLTEFEEAQGEYRRQTGLSPTVH